MTPAITAFARGLVLHADDFGMSEAVSRGIVQGFTHGLLTSTSILANGPACDFALAQWRDLQARKSRGDLPSLEKRRRLHDSTAPFDLGIHLNLTEGRPLTGDRYPRQLLDRDGRFPGVLAVAGRLLLSGSRFHDALDQELSAQIELLLDRGIAPTHLNAHQYVDMLPAVAAVLPDLLRRYAIGVVRVPWETQLTRTTLLRRFEPGNWLVGQIKRLFAFRHLVAVTRRGISHPSGYFGTCHAGRIDRDLLRGFLDAAGTGLTEIGMHPGCALPETVTMRSQEGWSDPLAVQRLGELALLISEDLVHVLESRQMRLARLSELSVSRRLAAAA
jgi:predicted glycoside hydrolase/deacetylase ChbG (UPF0249 family)